MQSAYCCRICLSLVSALLVFSEQVLGSDELIRNGDFQSPLEPCWTCDPEDCFPVVCKCERVPGEAPGDWDAHVYRGVLAGMAKVSQTILLGSPSDTIVSFSARLHTWRDEMWSEAAAMVSVFYLDDGFNPIAQTDYVKATYPIYPSKERNVYWIDHEDWFDATINIANEFSSDQFRNVSIQDVRFIQIVAAAVASGLMPGNRYGFLRRGAGAKSLLDGAACGLD